MRAVTVLDILEETSLNVPDKIAVIEANRRFSYKELSINAQIIGYALNRELAKQRKPIVLFMEKSFECLVSMYGTLYSGNFYVPMDIKTPRERFESILNTLKEAVILTTKEEQKILVKTGCKTKIFVYEELMNKYQVHICREEIETIRKSITDIDLMYIIFTSGSTGIPKGVAVMHRSVIDYIEAFLSKVELLENDIVGNQTPFYVDMSLKDIFMTMKKGATICIIPQKYFMTPKKLLQYLDQHGVTMLMWVPTAYRIIFQFDGLDKIKPRSLHKFLFSGEGMPIPVYTYWKKHYQQAVFIQQYGPTEITGACTSYTITSEYKEGETIPLGKPFPNTGILLLGDNGCVIQQNMSEIIGEICVYGTCLAAGYYNDPQKTEEVFVQNPLICAYQSKMYRTGDLGKWDIDGNLVFVSRQDYQIKHGGRRIELGEIEARAETIHGMKVCCCVYKRKEEALVLYYSGAVLEKEVCRQLQTKLPKYMVPTIYRKKEELPILHNGKLNRKKMDLWENE